MRTSVQIESFEKTPTGVRMNYSRGRRSGPAPEAALAVVAVGWQANTAGLNLDGERASRATLGDLSALISICERLRRIFLPLETSPVV